MAGRNFEADKMLDLCIYGYLRKMNCLESAEIFKTEAEVEAGRDATEVPEEFLSELWSIFWDFSFRRTNQNTNMVASSYTGVQHSIERDRVQHLHIQDMSQQTYQDINGPMVVPERSLTTNPLMQYAQGNIQANFGLSIVGQRQGVIYPTNLLLPESDQSSSVRALRTILPLTEIAHMHQSSSVNALRPILQLPEMGPTRPISSGSALRTILPSQEIEQMLRRSIVGALLRLPEIEQMRQISSLGSLQTIFPVTGIEQMHQNSSVSAPGTMLPLQEINQMHPMSRGITHQTMLSVSEIEQTRLSSSAQISMPFMSGANQIQHMSPQQYQYLLAQDQAQGHLGNSSNSQEIVSETLVGWYRRTRRRINRSSSEM